MSVLNYIIGRKPSMLSEQYVQLAAVKMTKATVVTIPAYVMARRYYCKMFPEEPSQRGSHCGENHSSFIRRFSPFLQCYFYIDASLAFC